MFFSKSLLAAACLVASLALDASAHAVVSPALGVQGAPIRADAQRPRKNTTPCGKTDVASTFDTTEPIAADDTNTFSATVTNFNRLLDGSRQMTALVDPTGTGNPASFVAATMIQNGERAPRQLGSEQLTVQLPAGMTCTGGSTGNKCLVSFTSASGFGNCIAVSQGSNSTATDTDTSDSATSTDAASTDTDASATSTASASTSTDSASDTDSTSTDTASASTSTDSVSTSTDSTSTDTDSSSSASTGTDSASTGTDSASTGTDSASTGAAAASTGTAAAGTANTGAKTTKAKAGKLARFIRDQHLDSRAVGTRAAVAARRAAHRAAA